MPVSSSIISNERLYQTILGLGEPVARHFISTLSSSTAVYSVNVAGRMIGGSEIDYNNEEFIHTIHNFWNIRIVNLQQSCRPAQLQKLTKRKFSILTVAKLCSIPFLTIPCTTTLVTLESDPTVFLAVHVYFPAWVNFDSLMRRVPSRSTKNSSPEIILNIIQKLHNVMVSWSKNGRLTSNPSFCHESTGGGVPTAWQRISTFRPKTTSNVPGTLDTIRGGSEKVVNPVINRS